MDDPEIKHADAQYNLIISYNVVSKRYSLEGHDKDLLIALGMLHWSVGVVNRAIVESEMIRRAQNAPRVAIPERRPP